MVPTAIPPLQALADGFLDRGTAADEVPSEALQRRQRLELLGRQSVIVVGTAEVGDFLPQFRDQFRRVFGVDAGNDRAVEVIEFLDRNPVHGDVEIAADELREVMGAACAAAQQGRAVSSLQHAAVLLARDDRSGQPETVRGDIDALPRHVVLEFLVVDSGDVGDEEGGLLPVSFETFP